MDDLNETLAGLKRPGRIDGLGTVRFPMSLNFVPFHSNETDTTKVSFVAICKNREAEGVRPNTWN
jgi:hypothetical protein